MSTVEETSAQGSSREGHEKDDGRDKYTEAKDHQAWPRALPCLQTNIRNDQNCNS